MATTNFIRGTVIAKEWLNDADALVYDVFGAPSTKAAAAGTLINGLTEDSSPATDDYVATYDTTGTTGKKVSIANLVALAPSPFPVADSTTILKGSSDATKLVRFEVDGITTGTTRVITVPDADITLVGAGTANTFTAAQAVRVDDATTNAVTTVVTVSHTTSGTPANNIGVGINFEVETSASNNEVGAKVEAIATDTTAASEDFKLSFKTMVAGAAATEAAYIAQGFVVGAPTGGDKGAGTGNYSGHIYSNGVQIYHARAWVNFNGTGTIAIRDSSPSLSIGDNGTGDYTVTFGFSYNNTSYCFTGIAIDSSVGASREITAYTGPVFSPAVGSIRFGIRDTTGTLDDVDYISMAFFGHY